MDEKYEHYTCEYQYGGHIYGVVICATSFSDAAARLKAIGQTGVVKGVIWATIPYELGWLAKFLIWFRNLWK